MSLADLLTMMDTKGVSLTQLERFERTDIGTFYVASVKVWKGLTTLTGVTGPSMPTQEAALEAAMRSTGLFPEFGKARRRREDLLA